MALTESARMRFGPTSLIRGNGIYRTTNRGHWDEPGGTLTDADLAKVQRKTYGLSGLGQWYPSSNELDYLPGMDFSDVPNAAGFSYDSRVAHKRHVDHGGENDILLNSGFSRLPWGIGMFRGS